MKWTFRYAYLLVAMNWRELTFRASNTKKIAPNHLLALIAIARKSQTCTHTPKIMCSHITDNGKIREIVVVKSDKIIVKVVTDKNAIFINLFFSFFFIINFLSVDLRLSSPFLSFCILIFELLCTFLCRKASH